MESFVRGDIFGHVVGHSEVAPPLRRLLLPSRQLFTNRRGHRGTRHFDHKRLCRGSASRRREQGNEVGKHDEAIPHLARSAPHPLPLVARYVFGWGCLHYGAAFFSISCNMPGISKTARLFTAAAFLRKRAKLAGSRSSSTVGVIWPNSRITNPTFFTSTQSAL